MAKSKYDCPECWGSGEAECENCGSDIKCPSCEGTGLDDEKIDVVAFQAAEFARRKEPGGGSWDFVVDGITVGRAGGKAMFGAPEWTVLYADFARKPAPAGGGA